MNCPNPQCKTTNIPDDAKFCHNCGHALLFDVILLDPGTNRLDIVKLIYKSTGLGLKEAKDMVDTAPSVIQRNIDVNIADVLKMKMEELGAMVAIFHM